MLWMAFHFNLKNYYVTIEFTVLHQFEPYLGRLSCINIFCLLRETSGLKINFEIGISILMFSMTSATSYSTVTLIVLTETNENLKRCATFRGLIERLQP